MTREFNNEKFHGLRDKGDKLLLSGMRFEACKFTNCLLSMTTDMNRISQVQNIELIDCIEDGVDVGPAILSNVTIHNLKTRDLFILWGTCFNQVTFSGIIGKTKINKFVHFVDRSEKTQRPFDDFRCKFYRDVEWALDISKAKFRDFDFRGIPGHLVKRDPESQILVTRKRALQFVKPGWKDKLDCANTYLPLFTELLISDGDEDTIFIAPLAASKSKRDPILKGLQEFRKIGLAEPD